MERTLFMQPDYTRPERLGFTIEDYDREYQKRYPDYFGPSSSSDCCVENANMNCGCWVCRMIEWKKEK